jgi:transposase
MRLRHDAPSARRQSARWLVRRPWQRLVQRLHRRWHPGARNCCSPPAEGRVMLALGPRDLAKAGFAAAIGTALVHIGQQCLAGFVQCSALGCLPW